MSSNVIIDESAYPALNKLIREMLLTEPHPTLLKYGNVTEYIEEGIKQARRHTTRGASESTKKVRDQIEEVVPVCGQLDRFTTLQCALYDLASRYENAEILLLSAFAWKDSHEVCFEFSIRRKESGSKETASLLYGGIQWRKHERRWSVHT